MEVEKKLTYSPVIKKMKLCINQICKYLNNESKLKQVKLLLTFQIQQLFLDYFPVL
jgi:hypothetical protein